MVVSQDITQKELVSIVIPTYNRTSFLREAINSALSQTYKNIEVIVVDDSSTDDVQEICKTYGSKIRYYRRRYKGGQSSALNKGISEMRGTWFKWLDSDNVLEDNAVEELLKFANEKDAKFVYSDFMYVGADGRVLGTCIEPAYSSYNSLAANLWLEFLANPVGTLIHKSLFEEVGLLDESLRHSNDYELWWRACIVHEIMFYKCPKLLSRYRISPGQVSFELNVISYLKQHMKLRQTVRQKYIERHGPGSWNKLMKKFTEIDRYAQWKLLGLEVLAILPSPISHLVLKCYNITRYVVSQR